MVESRPIWAAAWKRIRDQAFGQIVGGLVLSLTISAIDCGMLPEGEKCNVRTPIITAVVLTLYLIGVVLWNLIVRAPRDVALTALKRAGEAERVLKALTDRRSRDRAIRKHLAELIERGDQAWSAADMAHQIDQDNNPPMVAWVGPGVVREPPDWPQDPVPEWWKDCERWAHEVETYLPELGEEYLHLFRSQEDAVVSVRPEGPPLSTRNRTEADMKLIRLKQDKLKEFMKDFKD